MSKVNRSTYQKLAEENKRLISDIKLLVEEGMPSAKKILCIAKWRDKFKKESDFNKMMHEFSKQYIKENPNKFKFLKHN